MNKKDKKSALSVQKGVTEIHKISGNKLLKYNLSKKNLKEPDYYFSGIINSDISILSQAITLLESTKPEHKSLSSEIVNKCIPYSGNSLRIGITGVPGVGKSTFIELFGTFLIETGHKIAVLAVDPSSIKSKGSILGDKTRMEHLSVEKNAFIRPSPSSGSLGGVAAKTAETVILCEAAGFNIIFIETVGVGQSEIAVKSMVDFFLLLMLAGAGDELQGIKRGIMEMADLIVINKADGENLFNAQRAKVEYQTALHLFPPTDSTWEPKVTTLSSITGKGLPEIWETVENYFKLTKTNGYFAKNRSVQAKYRMYESVNERIISKFYSDNKIAVIIKKIENLVVTGKISPYFAAAEILNLKEKEL
jgi:LAO/AO transport system kinase